MEKPCRYYNGSEDHVRCEAGIYYAHVTPDWGGFGAYYRQPCFTVTSSHGLAILNEHGGQGRCSRFRPLNGECCGSAERY